MTLPRLSEATGISVSTLSRLESGQRRLTLELLLPLARAYNVPLDDLVGEPASEDPRVQARPVERHGMTHIPLTRRPGGVRAHKLIIPPRWPAGGDAQPRTHEGYEWFYVLAGRVRLMLAEREIVLRPGEAAEFDTHVPHAFSNPWDQPAELLSLFGPQGERLHLRARPAPGRPGRAREE
jgi:transcriptional regulator with XRE-family HTH domain